MTTLGGRLGTPWTQIVNESGSSLASFIELGDNVWSTDGTVINVAPNANGFPSAIHTGVGDEYATMTVAEVDVYVASRPVGISDAETYASGGLGMLLDLDVIDYTNNLGSNDQGNLTGSFAGATFFLREIPGPVWPAMRVGLFVTDSKYFTEAVDTGVVPDNWLTLRIEATFGIAAVLVNGVHLGSFPMTTRDYNVLSDCVRCVYPALIAKFFDGGPLDTYDAGIKFRNYRAWQCNPGPFA